MENCCIQQILSRSQTPVPTARSPEPCSLCGAPRLQPRALSAEREAGAPVQGHWRPLSRGDPGSSHRVTGTGAAARQPQQPQGLSRLLAVSQHEDIYKRPRVLFRRSDFCRTVRPFSAKRHKRGKMCSDLLREGPSPADGDGHSGRSGSCSPRVRLTSTRVLEQRERHLAPLWRKDVLLPRDLS